MIFEIRSRTIATINWNEEIYSVNVKELDWQHQKLMTLINELLDMTKQDKSSHNLEKVINSLVDYIHEHLRYEEKLLFDHHYPYYDKHKASHDNFEKKVQQFQKTFQKGHATFLVSEIGSFLIDWLINHIKSEDQLYSSFLNSKGLY